MNVIKYEKHFYPIVKDWLKGKGYNDRLSSHNFDKCILFNGDVVAWKADRSTGKADFLCELKAYPLPIGSGGYGSVGQVLALRKYARKLYVGCVASKYSHSGKGPEISWDHVVNKNSTESLLRVLGISKPSSEKNVEEYYRVAKQVFNSMFSGINIGFIVVHNFGNDSEFKVKELIPI